jgi:hypothetical protein
MTTRDPSLHAWAHVLERLACPGSSGTREPRGADARLAAALGERIAASRRSRRGAAERKPGKLPQAPSHSKITVLERPTETTATICWRDPTRCRYGEQNWQQGVAARRGYCAVSGLSIKRGDVIFRPARSRPAPCNVDEMILASALAQADAWA